MSNQNEASDFQNKPQKQLLLSLLGFVGCILIFVFILWVAYIPVRPAAPDQTRIEERYEIRRDVEARGRRGVDRLEVVEGQEGVFAIPVSDASRLVVSEFRKLQQEHGITQEGIPVE